MNDLLTRQEEKNFIEKNTNLKIPKIIHYFYDDVQIWEKNTKSQIRMCMNSWLKYCSDYKLMLWHDKMPEFQDIICKSKFARRAYELKLWAFVSDYVRIYALLKYGGIYLDTDVELIGDFNKFLNEQFFCSIEGDILYGENIPEPAIMGSVPNHPLLKKIMEIYESDDIFKIDNFIANVIMKKAMKELYNFEKIEYNSEDYQQIAEQYYDKEKSCVQLNDYNLYKNQKIWKSENDEITIYPCEYFCPTWCNFKQNAFSDKTVAIHWNQSSWWDDEKLEKMKMDDYDIKYNLISDKKCLKTTLKKIIKNLFSITNTYNKKHKVITIAFIKIKIRRK